MNNFALSGCNIGQDVHKLATRQVAYLAAPQPLHPLHGEVFKEQLVVSIRQIMGKFEEPVTALVDHELMQARDGRFRLAPVVGKLDLVGHLALGGLQFGHSRAIVQRAFNLFTVRRGEECFQPKVKARAFTRRGLMNWVTLFLNNEVQIKIAKTVTLDSDSLDIRAQWRVPFGREIAAFAELIDNAPDLDLVTLKQLPAGLFKRKAAVLLDFLEAWGRGLYLALEIAKEQLIGFINALDNVLSRLGVNLDPVAVLRQAL